MFVLKRLVAPLLFPVPLVLGLFVAGLLLLWVSHRQRAGRLLVLLGTLVLFAFSVEPVAHVLVATLVLSGGTVFN